MRVTKTIVKKTGKDIGLYLVSLAAVRFWLASGIINQREINIAIQGDIKRAIQIQI